MVKLKPKKYEIKIKCGFPNNCSNIRMFNKTNTSILLKLDRLGFSVVEVLFGNTAQNKRWGNMFKIFLKYYFRI